MATEFSKWLARQLEMRSLSNRELARRSTISNTTINNVISGRTRPTWDICAAVAEPLGESLWKVVKVAGLISGSAATSPALLEIHELVRRLPEEDHYKLLRYVKYLIWEMTIEEER